MSEREMDPYFREAFEAIRDAAKHMMAASQEIQAGGAALVRVSDAMIHARGEHEDLHETVARLERLAIEQGGELREIREELRQLRERLNGGGHA